MQVAIVSYTRNSNYDSYGYELVNYLFRNCSDWDEVTSEQYAMLLNWCMRKSDSETTYVLIKREDCIQESIKDCIKYAEQEAEKKRIAKEKAQEKKKERAEKRKLAKDRKKEKDTELKRKLYEELKKEFE